MKRALLPLSMVCALWAQPRNVLTSQDKSAGWHLLFDGMTFAGWDDPARKNPRGDSWEIADGCLKARAKPQINEDLLTTEAFANFELVFDWKISPGGNSGVKYRIQDRVFLPGTGPTMPGKTFEQTVDFALRNRRPDRPAQGQEYIVAFEYQVIDNDVNPDARRGPKYAAAALYDLIGPSAPAVRPVGEFNHSRILLRENRVEHWLNGTKVVDAQLDSPDIAAGAAKRWGKESRVYEMLTGQPRKACPISLQNHGDAAWFRDIKIRELR